MIILIFVEIVSFMEVIDVGFDMDWEEIFDVYNFAARSA